MRKAGVIWYDNEKKKFRVAIGKGQKHHIGRYNTEKEAKAALHGAIQGYRCLGQLRQGGRKPSFFTIRGIKNVRRIT